MRLVFQYFVSFNHKVSIHARVERATFSKLRCNWRSAGFNPRTRRACDSSWNRGKKEEFIVSIHARVERATIIFQKFGQSRKRFNPRTRRACDLFDSRTRQGTVGFNPRTRRACDRYPAPDGRPAFGFNPRTRRACDISLGQMLLMAIEVSIHARVERATTPFHVLRSFFPFQSTHA